MKALLLDRDGTLNVDGNWIMSPKRIQLLPHVIEGLQRFQEQGYRFFVFTNQSAVGLRLDTMKNMQACNAKVQELVAQGGITIERFYVCPHTPFSACTCRKPGTAMWDQLHQDEPSLDPSSCVMAGDKDADILFGQAIGAKTARIISPRYAMTSKPDYTVHHLLELADILFPL